MKLLLPFLLIVCIVYASITPVSAAFPYSPEPTTISDTLFSDTHGQMQADVIAAGLIVISNPPGAEVLVDGAILGNTPCTLPGLQSGVHIVRIRMPGYTDWTRTILIRDRHTVNLNAILVPVSVTPVLTVTPTPALTHPSITPLGTPIPRLTTFPTINPKPTLTHPSITPLGTPIPAASLKAISTPAGAAVFIDGINRGSTPCTVSGLTPGIHLISIRADGYRDVNKMILINSGESKVADVILVQTAPAT